jgi:NAD(P)H-quinone oxidoreductase subunit 2
MDFANIAAQLNAGRVLPEGIVILTLLTILVGDLLMGRTSAKWTPYAAIGGLLASVVALTYQWEATNPISFLGGFNGDALSSKNNA